MAAKRVSNLTNLTQVEQLVYLHISRVFSEVGLGFTNVKRFIWALIN